MRDLVVAAGGGGDPVGATIAAHTIVSHGSDPPVISTYAWERLEVDPTPGPLGVGQFTGLITAPEGPVVTSTTSPITPAGSTLPDLAVDLSARLLLIDPYPGLRSMAQQIRRMRDVLGGRVRIVDVGGDILTHGDEPTLGSPLVDALVLAACALANNPVTVYVAGPGTDGEVPQEALLERLAPRYHTPTEKDVASAAPALDWHPSEASALFAAATLGTRGIVRTVQGSIPLTDVSARIYYLALQEAIAHNPVAQALLDALPASVEEAADLSAKITGIHEMNRERGVAMERAIPGAGSPAKPSAPLAGNLPTSGKACMAALRQAADGATHCTFRFATRALGVDWYQIPTLRDRMNQHGPVVALS